METNTEQYQNTNYAAVIIFESSSEASDYENLYEEEIVRICAGSKDEARENAIAYAKGAEHSYQNEAGETISVTFKSLIDVQLMIEESEGVQTLYFRHFRDYGAYEAFEPLLKGQAL